MSAATTIPQRPGHQPDVHRDRRADAARGGIRLGVQNPQRKKRRPLLSRRRRDQHGRFPRRLELRLTFRLPCVFTCVNNGWAISVPRSKQTASETFAQKGAGLRHADGSGGRQRYLRGLQGPQSTPSIAPAKAWGPASSKRHLSHRRSHYRRRCTALSPRRRIGRPGASAIRSPHAQVSRIARTVGRAGADARRRSRPDRMCRRSSGRRWRHRPPGERCVRLCIRGTSLSVAANSAIPCAPIRSDRIRNRLV